MQATNKFCVYMYPPAAVTTPCVFGVAEQQLPSVRTLLVVLVAHHILLYFRK